MLVCVFMYTHTHTHTHTEAHAHTRMCAVGYSVGLVFAIFASIAMRMGQPALLYLVPCTLIPFLLLAW
jgi:hypothetical protein